MKVIINFLVIPFIIITGLIVSSCFLEKIGDNAVSISSGLLTLIKGSLGAGFSTSSGQLNISYVDKVWAVPLKGGSGGTWTAGIFEDPTSSYAPNYVAFDVSYDLMGKMNFAVDISRLKGKTVLGEVWNGDWALILVNSKKSILSYSMNDPAEYAAATALRKDCLVSYLAMSDSESVNNNTLVRMPVNQIKDLSEVDMGTVNRSNDGSEAQSTKSIDDNADKIDISTETLKARAGMDNVYKNIKNVYVNTKILPVPVYTWSGNSISFAKLVQTTSRGVNELTYNGFSLAFNYDWNQLHAILSASDNVKVKVPGTVVYRYYDKTLNDLVTVTYEKGDYIPYSQLSVGQMFTGTSKHVMLNGNIMNVPPAGWFELAEGETTYGYFDVSLVNPFVGATTDYTIVYMPVLTLTVDSGTPQKVTAVSVDWYIYRNGSYVKVEGNDLQELYNNISQENSGHGDFMVTFREFINNQAQTQDSYSILLNGTTAATVSDTHDWYYSTSGGTPADSYYITSVDVRYMYAGVSFEFYWYKD